MALHLPGAAPATDRDWAGEATRERALVDYLDANAPADLPKKADSGKKQRTKNQTHPNAMCPANVPIRIRLCSVVVCNAR
jgi:hypothetical protein